MDQANNYKDSPEVTHTADTRNPDWDKYAPEGQGRTDEQIRADVHQVLLEKGGDVGKGVAISVGDGIVTLSGKVGSQDDQKRVEQLVRSVPSVKEVRGQLSVS